MAKYYNIEPLVNLLADKDLLETVNVGAVLQALQHGLYNGEAAPVVHAHWTRKRTLSHDGELYCSKCEWTPEVLGGTTLGDLQLADVYYCPHCGAKMDEKEGNL